MNEQKEINEDKRHQHHFLWLLPEVPVWMDVLIVCVLLSIDCFIFLPFPFPSEFVLLWQKLKILVKIQRADVTYA